MTKEEHKHLTEIVNGNAWEVRSALIKFLKTATVLEEPKTPRTGKQNNTIHGFCDRLAEALNLAGKDMRVVIKPDYFIPWTTDSVKEYIWRPIQIAMYNKKSTKELKKTGEIDNIHKVIMREIGEKHGIDYIPFGDDEQSLINMSGEKLGQVNNKHKDNYPTDFKKPLI